MTCCFLSCFLYYVLQHSSHVFLWVLTTAQEGERHYRHASPTARGGGGGGSNEETIAADAFDA